MATQPEQVFREALQLKQSDRTELLDLLIDSLDPESEAGAGGMKALVTVNDARAYAESCHQAAQAIFRALSEEDLTRPVESPFGTYPAWRYFAFAYDEHWHHRGQLYTYFRLLDKEPPMLYDYGS